MPFRSVLNGRAFVDRLARRAAVPALLAATHTGLRLASSPQPLQIKFYVEE
jgi:hypothetical protein